MLIANPIYDVVFSHLMRNNEIAILMLSAIIEEEIVSLNFLPLEISFPRGNRFFTVYWLNFSARIKMSSGEEKHVIIEIRKAKFAADIMRFQRHIENQHKKVSLVEGNKAQKAVPIIGVYFLEHELDHVDVPIIKVIRRYYDVATGKEISVRDEFIESLSHDSFVIQIPYLGPACKTAAERLLVVFDQHRKFRGDQHLLDIDEEAYPEEHRRVVHWLSRAVAIPDIRQTMEVEDEILAELEDK
ncbi:MAG: hypothetical protein HKP13_04095, partial [Gammaproteobacteria bacterium]|nr:hypothetical protein [Gammaproteobacteria bacterium]